MQKISVASLCIILAISMVILAMGPVFAAGKSQHNNEQQQQDYDVPAPLDDCMGGTVAICGVQVPVTAARIGYQAILTVPRPYIHERFTATCLNNGVASFFQITDSSAVTCTKAICQTSNVQVCGQSVAVEGGTAAGRKLDANIPPVNGAAPEVKAPTFAVECADNGASLPFYRLADAIGVSCSAFPCAAASVDICDTPVAIPGGAAMGTILDMTVPNPYRADHFKVECHGSNGTGPIYQIVDQAGVSCLKTK